jgi:IstB-like ATP binding protein
LLIRSRNGSTQLAIPSQFAKQGSPTSAAATAFMRARQQVP